MVGMWRFDGGLYPMHGVWIGGVWTAVLAWSEVKIPRVRTAPLWCRWRKNLRRMNFGGRTSCSAEDHGGSLL